jgi:hypothetical protein
MEIKDKKYRDIFNNFKKYNSPLPIIELKINQQNKLIEGILKEMDKNYKSVKPPQTKQKSENKTRNKRENFMNNKKCSDKIDFGSDAYLTYKLSNNEEINTEKKNIESLRQKVLNSNNFRFGYLNAKIKNNNLYKKKEISLTGIKKMMFNKNRMNFNDKKKNRPIINICNSNSNLVRNDKIEKKNDFANNNDNYYMIETDFSTNRNYKSTKEVIRNTSPFDENIKKKEKSNSILHTNTNYKNRSYTHLINKKFNSTNYSRNNNNIYNNNNNNNIKYNITNYMDKKMPNHIDVKFNTITDNSKTATSCKDYKNLFTYNRTNNYYLNTLNNNIHMKPLLKLTEEIYNINDIMKLNEKKLNHISKKKLKIKHIEKLIRKNVISNSIIELLMNGRKHKVKLRSNMKKMKRQMKHLSVVDKIEKYSDDIPSGKMESFNEQYNKKSERIGISNNCITFRNGKIYQQSKSESKKLREKIIQNCDEINRLTDQILIDKYYFERKNLKCQKILETIQYENNDSFFDNNI